MLVLVIIVFSVVSMSIGNTDDHENWNKKFLYKATANFTCEDPSFDPLKQQDVKYHWLIPSGAVIGISLPLPHDRYSFVNNGSTLLIRNIDKPDFGVYFCLVTTNYERSVYRSIKFGLNVDGPYFGDLWERYLPNLKMGLLASGVTFIVMSMFCYNLSQFQNRNDKPKKYEHSNNVDISLKKTNYEEENATHLNSAFVSDLQENIEDVSNTEISTVTVVQPKTNRETLY